MTAPGIMVGHVHPDVPQWQESGNSGSMRASLHRGRCRHHHQLDRKCIEKCIEIYELDPSITVYSYFVGLFATVSCYFVDPFAIMYVPILPTRERRNNSWDSKMRENTGSAGSAV